MITISKLGVGTAQNYYRTDFAAESNRYYSQEQTLQGRWQGKLAAEWGLAGAVTDEQYDRLTNGQHPITGEQLIKHRHESDKAMAHTAAWDITFSPGKSVSLVALVGGDERVVQSLQKANDHALQVMEQYVQQRMGGLNLPQTTGKWIAATFEHDTSRPVDGYPAPNLHFHNPVMNMSTQHSDSQVRSLLVREIYKAQTLGEAVFQSDIAADLRRFGYDVVTGPTHSAEVGGFSQEYLDAESPRNREIRAELERRGMTGSVIAGKNVAKEFREKKLQLTPEQVKAVHQVHGEAFGDQAHKLVSESIERGPRVGNAMSAEKAVEFARQRLCERLAVFEHYELVRDALKVAHGALTFEQVEAEVSRRIENGGVVVAQHVRPHAPMARYTTPEQLEIERGVIEFWRQGRNSVEPIWSGADLSQRGDFADNPKRLEVLEGFLKTRDQITGMNGAAGSAKSTSLSIIADHAHLEGFRVKGLAPTGGAAVALGQKGVATDTLQSHIVKHLRAKKSEKNIESKAESKDARPVVYFVDEASLVSARQMSRFLKTVRSQDRVILIGDDAPEGGKVGQHTAVEAGRPFYQLQAAGMKTAQLNKIYRQKVPWMKDVVLSLRNGDTERAVTTLVKYEAVHEYSHRQKRFNAISEWFAEAPNSALVVTPDNESRREINAAIREALQWSGQLSREGMEVSVLVPRDLLGADRTQVVNYRVGDELRYIKDIAALGVKSKSYATVTAIDQANNKLTVRTQNGREQTYDPSRSGSGVSVFEKRRQVFAEGEHIQFTAVDKKLGVTSRSTGVIKSLDAAGNARIQLSDTERTVKVNLKQHRHLEYSYSSTSHLAQARTVERCAAQVDTGDHRLHALVNEVFSYVAGSRPEYELAVFTDNQEELAKVMGREHVVHTALTPEQVEAVAAQMVAEVEAEAVSMRRGMGMSV